MEKEHNILLLTDVNYWKQEIGSHQRVYALIEYLKTYYNITIAYTKQKQEEDNSYIKKLTHNIIFIDELESSVYSLNKIETILEDNPILKQFYNEDTTAKTQTLLKENNFTHIIVEYIKLSYLLPLFEEKITILDTHDIMNKRNDSFKKNNQFHWIDINEEQELKILAFFDKVVCIQEVEHNYLLEKGIQSICCPHPVKAENFLKETKPNEIKNIIFIGGYSIANNNSIKWFITNIWSILQHTQSLRLNIYGDVSKSVETYIEKYQNIFLHGKIDNLSQAYKNATIAINPVQMGGGLKIKNIEALAYGIPLVTTSEGSKGLQNQINNSFFLANTKDEWVEKIISLTISTNLRTKFSQNSTQYISKYFNTNSCFKNLVQFINKNTKS